MLEPRDAPDPRAHLHRRVPRLGVAQERTGAREVAGGAVDDAEEEGADGEFVGWVEVRVGLGGGGGGGGGFLVGRGRRGGRCVAVFEERADDGDGWGERGEVDDVGVGDVQSNPRVSVPD